MGTAVSEHDIKLRGHVPFRLDCSEQVLVDKWLSSSVLFRDGRKGNC